MLSYAIHDELHAQGLAEDPDPPVDDEANDAALPEPDQPQGPDVKNDEIDEEGTDS